MHAEIIFTGTELLLGQVVNTHGQYLGNKLSSLGIEINKHTVVGDNSHNLKDVFQNALSKSNIVLTTGGLGPTTDDVTKDIFAELLGLELVLDDEALNSMEEFFSRRGLQMPNNVISQAYIPRGSKALPNLQGSAPGIMVELKNCTIFMLPGPPWELRSVFENHVEKYLESKVPGGNVNTFKVIKVTGISESAVQEKLLYLEIKENTNLAYIAKPGEVHVRISARAVERSKAQDLVDELSEKVKNNLLEYIIGVDDEILEEMVGNFLREKGMTISCAESCTGGLIAQRLTDISGSSQYFTGSIVAYNNFVKKNLLGVSSEILEEYGAVSSQTAKAMAEGACRVTGSDIGVGVTGIAGPQGGSPEKPIGLVYIALVAGSNIQCRRFTLPGQRPGVRWGASNAALSMVRHFLRGYQI
ncbi:MAG: competence/damage-inducible protein A [Clostridiales bacterium]|nr:competence/damage-inducible protein A [Clostridiales bacterium]MCF8023408.1 competence/damage-inducible protein A [Clostridiales bacterium]